ncbi:hypothetical protein MLD38_039405 [Melastoma candidum]|uniref:Uncharacterized protein n=1 Tax=Melastoma candidum TaxID=119954 RepID=A0ACB9L2W0_9MYRT|nr:hypothetical protein MLD38_039405 [Melastoma candidum]
MTSAAARLFKPLSVADTSYHQLSISLSLFPSPDHHRLSFPLKTPSLPLSSSSSFVPSSRKFHSANLVVFVAEGSDWGSLGDEDSGAATSTATALDLDLGLDQGESGFESFDVQGGGDVSEGEGSVGEEEEEEEAAAVVEEEAFVEPPEDAKLFVGNLPYDVDSQKLAMLFEQAGTVEIAEVIYNRETDQSRGFGFVTMSTVEEAEKAVDTFHRYDMNGRFLTVNKAAPRGARPERPARAFEPSFRIYVGNLPWDVDNGRLEQLFSEHGKVTSARVVYDRDSGRSRGFGFVTMASEDEMNDAIAALDGQSLDGRAIRVNVAEERRRRDSF